MNKSLDELEGIWGEPPAGVSRLVGECHRLHRIPIGSIGSPTPIADAQAGDRGRSPKGRVGRRGRTTSPRGKPTFLAAVTSGRRRVLWSRFTRSRRGRFPIAVKVPRRSSPANGRVAICYRCNGRLWKV